MKEEVGVVVDGLVADWIVTGTLVAAATVRALMLTKIDVLLMREHVELIVQLQVVVPVVNVTSVGTVMMMLEPVVRALIVVKETVMSDTMPMEGVDMEAELVVIVDTTADTVTLPESME